MPYQAEYIWIDGTKPSPIMRSKTRIVADGKEPDIWGFDGSSTNQAPGANSDCVLRPVYTCPDPIRGGDNILVLCDVELTDFTPHPTLQNGRRLGGPETGSPAPQGPYYCGVGGEKMVGRAIIEAHTIACLKAGLSIEGTNAEVMMGQFDFFFGVLPAPMIGDQMWVARWLLHRIAEDFDVVVSFDAKPMPGDWNGAGAHTNFSTKATMQGYDAIVTACEALGRNADAPGD